MERQADSTLASHSQAGSSVIKAPIVITVSDFIGTKVNHQLWQWEGENPSNLEGVENCINLITACSDLLCSRSWVYKNNCILDDVSYIKTEMMSVK